MSNEILDIFPRYRSTYCLIASVRTFANETDWYLSEKNGQNYHPKTTELIPDAEKKLPYRTKEGW